jgi:hypothetical protein
MNEWEFHAYLHDGRTQMEYSGTALIDEQGNICKLHLESPDGVIIVRQIEATDERVE